MSKSKNKKLYQQNLKLKEQIKTLTNLLQPQEAQCKYNSYIEFVDSEDYDKLYEAYKQSGF